MEKSPKVYVEVKACFDTEGRIFPMSITREDGREYEIDRILNVRPAVSLKARGAGIRYCVRIGKSQTYLFLEENKWFVERR